MSNENVAITLDQISLKRREIYTSLRPFFETRELLNAMWLWEENYASGHEKSMRRYVNEICQGGLRHKAKSIYFNLMSHLNGSDVELEEDPYKLMLAFRSGKLVPQVSTVSKLSVLTEPMIVFNWILRHYIERLSEEAKFQAVQVRSYVEEALTLGNSDLVLAQLNELRIWMKYMEGELEYNYSVTQMAKLLHLLYIGTCEYFGPQRADLCLSQTIAEANKLPAAKQFPPQSML